MYYYYVVFVGIFKYYVCVLLPIFIIIIITIDFSRN